jgi:hypothetical protein
MSSDWYDGGWRSVGPGPVLSYEDWVATAVKRWWHSPSVAMWELMRELEPLTPFHSWTDAAEETFRNVRRRGRWLVHSLDNRHAHHSGRCGTARPDYEFVDASPALEVLQYHDCSVPLLGARCGGLALHIEQCDRLPKQIYAVLSA